ncbi:MAG: hypothetical protein J0H42_16450 [Rhizobiales bacterium]|nr:hypothetical protein [Hyphomicrobiales bacterium]
MKWMKERDLLIAQTMAFVQSVTGKKPDADLFAARPAASAPPAAPAPADASKSTPAAVTIPDIEAMLAEPIVAPPKPAQSSRPEPRVDFQSEIRARVANFRAHQERFNREREAYGSATMAKVHAALREDPVPPRLGK